MRTVASVAVVVILLLGVECRLQCVMRGECADDELTMQKRPCVYNGRPQRLQDQEAVTVFKKMCPNLSKGPNFETCCDASQILAMQKNFDPLIVLFSRCPSCLHNFQNNFCQLFCSPFQSNFVQVQKSTRSGRNETVTEVDYFVTERFAQGMFDSCKSVKLGPTNSTAITIACGAHINDCTAHRWLDFMGEHDPSPFKINFHYKTSDIVSFENNVFIPMNESIIPCSQSVNYEGTPCSPEDCPLN